jgi:hypothetical protein
MTSRPSLIPHSRDRPSPHGLRPAIARIIEALARDAVRREDREIREAALREARGGEVKP